MIFIFSTTLQHFQHAICVYFVYLQQTTSRCIKLFWVCTFNQYLNYFNFLPVSMSRAALLMRRSSDPSKKRFSRGRNGRVACEGSRVFLPRKFTRGTDYAGRGDERFLGWVQLARRVSLHGGLLYMCVK